MDTGQSEALEQVGTERPDVLVSIKGASHMATLVKYNTRQYSIKAENTPI